MARDPQHFTEAEQQASEPDVLFTDEAMDALVLYLGHRAERPDEVIPPASFYSNTKETIEALRAEVKRLKEENADLDAKCWNLIERNE